MDTKTCADCPMRAKYDKRPKSFIGRLWRWHIGFCPGWKKYLNSLSETERQELPVKYQLKFPIFQAASESCNSISLKVWLSSVIILFVNTVSGSENKRTEIESFLQKAVKTYNIPALSISIVEDNDITYCFNEGKDDNSSPITSDTPFYLGSTSKTFTALAVMLLVEKGKIELDKPIKNYLFDFEIGHKTYEVQITVRHLLNHTSGLSAKHIQGSSMGLDNLDDELKVLDTQYPVNAPGIHYEYFNSNYRVLGLLIERVSGMPFEDFLYKEVFQPLGMSRTTAGLMNEIKPVCGHGQLFGIPIRLEQVFRKGAVPSGYMISTATDVSKFLIEELKSYKGESAILNKETVLKTWQPFDESGNSYAMGWLAVTDSTGSKCLIHGGALEGYQSFFYLNPDKNSGFVILMNQGGLFPMISFNVIRDGLISIIDNKQPNIGMKKTPLIIAVIILLLVFSLYTLRIIRLSRRPNFSSWRKISLILDFAIALFIIGGFIPLMNWLMGDKADWKMLWNMLPEFCLLLAVICVGCLICGSIKIKQLLAIKEWKFLSGQKRLRGINDLQIVDYEDKYHSAFKSLNEELIKKYFEMEEADYKALDNPEEYILNKGGKIVVVLYKNDPVGVCALLKINDPEYDYELAKMAVSPKMQGKNIDFMLGKAILDKARESGVSKIYLESNAILKPAINLYHKLGFKEVKGHSTQYKRCNIQMGLTLKD